MTIKKNNFYHNKHWHNHDLRYNILYISHILNRGQNKKPPKHRLCAKHKHTSRQKATDDGHYHEYPPLLFNATMVMKHNMV